MISVDYWRVLVLTKEYASVHLAKCILTIPKPFVPRRRLPFESVTKAVIGSDGHPSPIAFHVIPSSLLLYGPSLKVIAYRTPADSPNFVTVTDGKLVFVHALAIVRLTR